MPVATRSISFEGDKTDIRALRSMADDRGITLARFVRETLEQVHGEEFRRTRSFFAKESSGKNQMVPSGVPEPAGD